MKILVVDDQETNRGLLSYLLEEEGHEVIEARNGFEGVEKFDSLAPDLVLMDVMMPGMDGYEAARSMKARTDRYVPIIFLTALCDDQSLSRCIESGGDDFLTKPVNEVLLAAKIKAHERISELNNELGRKNKELESLHVLLRQEHDLAEHVFQTAISGHADCENVRHFLSPMGGFSGDVILASRTSRDSLFVMLGDFTGHGLPAALGALPISQAFETLSQQGVTLGDLVTHINSILYDYLPAYMFCAANLIEFNLEGTRAKFWSGGLPDMFVVDEQGLISKTLPSGHIPLGVLSERSFKRDIQELELQSGDRLIVYSDGVTDCCNIDGEMLGQDRLEKMFDGRFKGAELFDHLVSEVRSFGEGRPQDDDISLLEVLAKPLRREIKPSNPSQHLAWTLSTEFDLSAHREIDLVARLLSLFANRSSFRMQKDRIHQIVLRQYRRLVDERILHYDWEELGLVDEDNNRRIARSNALDKLKNARIFVRVECEPAASLLKVYLADREIPGSLDIHGRQEERVAGELIEASGSGDEGHCQIVEIPVRFI